MAVLYNKDVKFVTCFQDINKNASKHQIFTTGAVYSIFVTVSNIYNI